MPESFLQRLRYFLKINEDTKHYKIMHLLSSRCIYFIYSEYVQLWVLYGSYGAYLEGALLRCLNRSRLHKAAL